MSDNISQISNELISRISQIGVFSVENLKKNLNDSEISSLCEIYGIPDDGIEQLEPHISQYLDTPAYINVLPTIVETEQELPLLIEKNPEPTKKTKKHTSDNLHSHFHEEMKKQAEYISERLQKVSDRITNIQKKVLNISDRMDMLECV